MASDGESEFIPLGSKRRRTGFYKTGQVGKTVSFNKKRGQVTLEVFVLKGVAFVIQT